MDATLRQIGRYEIERLLGSGGMGSVYLAHDPNLKCPVAIKLLRGGLDSPDLRERFKREARQAASLRTHPNVVTIHDFGEHESMLFIVMEYIDGKTLARIIADGQPALAVSAKLRLLEQLCDGLAYAHAQKILHRDIKPANLMLDPLGHLKILDFGIARIIGTLMRTTSFIGTPGYMSPEQIRAADDLDERSDLFAVGGVSYELLAGREAFPGDTQTAIMLHVLERDPVPLSRVYPDVDAELASIVHARSTKSEANGSTMPAT